MAMVTSEDFVEAIEKARLLEPSQLKELTQQFPAPLPEPRTLARHLLQRDWLTPYQVNHLLQGRGGELVLGQYILLERLGEGGMGQVFKARHLHLHRVVALKLIRREYVSHPEAIRRFHREIRAAAQLTHPNIVMAYDADQVAGTHIFVMEYVDGVDLSTLLKQYGPPSPEQACDFVRQAALGLQHACERGMVHRDIKPANLLLTGARKQGAGGRGPESASGGGLAPKAWPVGAGAIIKILDMGLARIQQLDAEESASALTKEGRVVGTPDYMAPEQAVNPHTIDIRADLYSLGCTFYQLLTGRVPFPGGTIMEKLLQHRMDAPRPIEQIRPQASREIGAIVGKLLAKQPQDRYQTPGELADALTPRSGTTAVAIPMAQIVESDTIETEGAWTPDPEPPMAIPLAQPVAPGRTSRTRWVVVLAIVVGTIVLGVALVLGVVLTRHSW